MIVVIGGMQRSGSTFSFNVARDYLSSRGAVYQEPENDFLNVVSRSGESDFVIMKSHSVSSSCRRLINLGAAKSICTVRRPEDAIASWMETFGFTLERSIDDLKEWLDMFVEIRAHSLVIDYDDIDRRPFYAAWRIGRFLGYSSPFEAHRIAKRHSKSAVKALTDNLENADRSLVDIGFSQYDGNTLYHRRHVSTLKSRDAAERLPAEAIRMIRDRLARYIDDRGRLTMAT